jgi:hypothetical protein
MHVYALYANQTEWHTQVRSDSDSMQLPFCTTQDLPGVWSIRLRFYQTWVRFVPETQTLIWNISLSGISWASFLGSLLLHRMCVCMYAWMYVIYTSIHAHVTIWLLDNLSDTCILTHISTGMHTYNTHTHTHMHTFTHYVLEATFICKYVCTHTFTYITQHVLKGFFTCMFVCAYRHAHVCIYMHMCVCIHTCTCN